MGIMSVATNNPITNAIDFITHGSKGTSIGMIENQFDVQQPGSGVNNRDGNTSCHVDINAGNYPIDVADTDTNTGKSFSKFEGIPNITLKGNSVSGTMPLYPLTKYQNKHVRDGADAGQISDETLQMYEGQHSIMDLMDLLKNTFGLKQVISNLAKELKYDDDGFGEEPDINSWKDSSSNGINDLSTVENMYNNCVYISLTSAVTQWVRVSKIQIKVKNLQKKATYPGLNDTSGKAIIFHTAEVEVKLIIDGSYCPRQMIGNGMSHQQLFVWGKHGSDIDNILQFSKTDYLVYIEKKNNNPLKGNALNNGNALSVDRDNINEKQITFDDPSGIVKENTYLYAQGETPYNTSVL